MLICRAL